MNETTPRRIRWGAVAATAVAFALIASATSFAIARFGRTEVVQPIAFNHRKHVVDNSIECSTCHAYYETETFSGLPDADTCAPCHAEPIGKSAEEKKLVALLQSGKPLVFTSMFRQPAHVFYSHRRHVVKAKLACEQCHGQFAKTSSPPTTVTKLRMNDCIGCHTKQGVATDCTTCHR